MGGRGASSARGGQVSKSTFTVKRGDSNVQLTMKVKTIDNNGLPKTFVTVTRKGGISVATTELTHRKSGGLYPEHVTVDQPFQRLGIASRMYAAAEKSSGRSVLPSETQTPQGKAFSAAFRSRRS